MLFLYGDVFQHGVITFFVNKVHQPDRTKLYFILYLYFICQRIITRQEFTNLIWDHNYFCWFLKGLFLLLHITNFIKIPQKVKIPHHQCTYIPPYVRPPLAFKLISFSIYLYLYHSIFLCNHLWGWLGGKNETNNQTKQQQQKHKTTTKK